MSLKTADSVRAAMMAKIAGSLLDAKDATKLKFKPMTAEQVKALDVPCTASGFMIPYFDLDGKQSKFWRFRYLEDTRKGFDVLNGRKELRYVQPGGGVNEVYLAPFLDWRKIAENPTIPIIITEGELKSAASTKAGLPAIGLGGVWCFKSTAAKASLLPMMKLFVWKDRTVYICYDSDAASNPLVVMAENHLAKELTAQGSDVMIVRMPTAEDGSKVGVDDYLLTNTPSDFKTLLSNSNPYAACFALHEMSERVVYIRNPGLVYDFKNTMRLSTSDFTSHAYANYWHDEASGDKIVKKPTAIAWLQWPQRNELESITFAPGQPKTFSNKLNLWDGWPLTPKKGSVAMWKELLDRLFETVDPGARKWFEQWCAYPIQNPGAKMASCVCFWGSDEGSGKTLVANTLMKIYGQYAGEETDAALEDDRCDWAENKQFVLLDDITGTTNRRLANRIKTMTTQKTLKINPKYVPRYTVPDCVNYYLTSNDPDAFYMDDSNRRNFIHEVTSGRLPKEMRDRYIAWMDSEDGQRALFYYLLNVDLIGFDPHGDAYYTAAKADMINLTKSDIASWVANLKANEGKQLKLPGDLYSAAELLSSYDPMGQGKVTTNGMARELKRAGYRAPGTTQSMAVTKFGNVRLYAIKNQEFWKKAKTKAVVDHYESHRAMEPVARKRESKVKF